MVDNIITDSVVTTGPLNGKAAVIALSGDGHYCAGNEIVGGTYDWLVWTNGEHVVLGPNVGATGRLGRYGDDGSPCPGS